MEAARDLGFAVGVEVPALKGLPDLGAILPLVDFLNINELDWGESNAFQMRERGYELADELHNAIEGAQAWAEEIRRHDKVPWCSSAFKDSVQLRERLKRIAHNTARAFDEITPDGTVVYGVLEPPAGQKKIYTQFCEQEFEPGCFEICGDRIEMAWWLLEKNCSELQGKKYVVERYPNGGMVVEVTPSGSKSSSWSRIYL